MYSIIKNTRIPALLLVFSVLILDIPLTAQRTKSSLRAGQQRNAEKGLKDNRYFFYFINSSISNFGEESEIKAFKEAIQRDILSQLLYMKFLFNESFEQIRKAQEMLIGLYRKTIIRDIRITMELLNDYAPQVIKSNDPNARLYLKLGYRDSAVAKQYMVMADNYRQKLYSLRLYRYVKAIKKAKHGKRYAFLSALQSRLKDKERVIGLRWKSFEDLEKLLIRFYPHRKDYLLKIHYDNYYRTPGRKTFYDRVWEKPDFHELSDYEEYMKKQ